MPDPKRPTLIYFKLFGCPACEYFDREFFRLLVNDVDVLQAVNIDEVTFGRGQDYEYVLDELYPDFDVKYAPFIWLAAPYDETKGYHLNPATMRDPKLNTRLNGQEYQLTDASTYGTLKNWILENTSRTGNKFKRSNRK